MHKTLAPTRVAPLVLVVPVLFKGFDVGNKGRLLVIFGTSVVDPLKPATTLLEPPSSPLWPRHGGCILP